MIGIREEDASALEDYATISIAYEMRNVLDVDALGDASSDLRLAIREVDVPSLKDYDTLPGNYPTEWTARFDLRRWGILSAWEQGARVGGAVVAFDTPGVDMLEGRRDLAVLWDLRVAWEYRGGGIGTALFGAVEEWAARRGAQTLKIETQDVNTQACRFYARQGCELRAINRSAYADAPGEIQLLWYKHISPAHVSR